MGPALAAEGSQVPQTRKAALPAPAEAPSVAELYMILKTMQSLVGDFPKLEAGDPNTRASRFRQWLMHIAQTIEPAGPHVKAWWQWVSTAAEQTHSIFLSKPLDQREHVYPQEALPAQFAQLESWMRPRILACLPRTPLE